MACLPGWLAGRGSRLGARVGGYVWGITKLTSPHMRSFVIGDEMASLPPAITPVCLCVCGGGASVCVSVYLRVWLADWDGLVA